MVHLFTPKFCNMDQLPYTVVSAAAALDECIVQKVT